LEGLSFLLELLEEGSVVALARGRVRGGWESVVLSFELGVGGFGLAEWELKFLDSLLNRDQGECRWEALLELITGFTNEGSDLRDSFDALPVVVATFFVFGERFSPVPKAVVECEGLREPGFLFLRIKIEELKKLGYVVERVLGCLMRDFGEGPGGCSLWATGLGVMLDARFCAVVGAVVELARASFRGTLAVWAGGQGF
jgi:hypothetical protein